VALLTVSSCRPVSPGRWLLPRLPVWRAVGCQERPLPQHTQLVRVEWPGAGTFLQRKRASGRAGLPLACRAKGQDFSDQEDLRWILPDKKGRWFSTFEIKLLMKRIELFLPKDHTKRKKLYSEVIKYTNKILYIVRYKSVYFFDLFNCWIPI